MNERLSHLLAKRQTGQITSTETAELARLLNAPILDPLEDRPVGFVSRYDFAPSDIGARLQTIDWFSRCGAPLCCDLSMAVEQVQSWPHAVDACADVIWENVQLLHAADMYTTFAGNEPAADRRKDVYRCIVTCMTTGPDAVWQVLRPQVLSQAEAEQVVNRFFGRQA